MAFVFRDQRKFDSKHKNSNVGPGSYNFDVQRQNKIPKAYVPFGSMEPKVKESKYPSQLTPGPGTYNIDPPQNGQKIVVSSETQDIKILEISRPHPVFKSGTQRFNRQPQDAQNPGPGAYNINKNDNFQRQKIYSQNATAKPKIIEHLININKYQSIPSIPSNVHAFGYNQNQQNELQLNEPPIEVFKGQKQDKVGPGQYNINPNYRARGSSWSQAKQKRFSEMEKASTNANVGPGAYQTKTVQPLYSFKPTAEFSSKTMRGMDQRKGAVANRLVQQRANKDLDPVQSRIFSEKGAASTHIGDDQSDDDEYQYIQETTPGPGSYLEVYQPKKYQVKKMKTKTNFGLSKRFEQKPLNPNVGPGVYNTKQPNFKKQSRKPNGEVPNDIERFPGLVNKKNVELPAPGSYEPRNTMEDKLIYKIQRGYRGQFGSTEGRFKEVEEQEKPGPGQYDVNHLYSEKQVSAVFKSKSNRKAQYKGNFPAPGAYTINQYDISTRVIKQEEDDPDLIIKKPGFGVGQQRFKQQPKRQDDFDDDDIIKQIQEKNREQKKRKMLKNSSTFKSRDPRFKEERKEAPGPGSYYDGQEDYWNKRTYNILFADI